MTGQKPDKGPTKHFLIQRGDGRSITTIRNRTEIQDARSAIFAAVDQTQQATLNVSLARELQATEPERFFKGATDLLALQLREQAAFEAELTAVSAPAVMQKPR